MDDLLHHAFLVGDDFVVQALLRNGWGVHSLSRREQEEVLCCACCAYDRFVAQTLLQNHWLQCWPSIRKGAGLAP